jgi:hypothetical protein
MTDIDPQFVPHKYSPRFYGSASLLVQEGIDGFDDDPEKRLNRKDDERNYADAQSNPLVPCRGRVSSLLNARSIVLPHYFASEIAPYPIISAEPKSSGQNITMNHKNLLSTLPGPRVSSFTATQFRSNRMGQKEK